MILDHSRKIASVTGYLRFLFRTFWYTGAYYSVAKRASNMRTHATRQGRVVALCDYCSNTIEFIGLYQAEEKVGAKGWTVRHGRTRCAACGELEGQVLARALAKLGADLSLPILLAECPTKWS